MSHVETSLAKRAAAEISRRLNVFNKNSVWSFVNLNDTHFNNNNNNNNNNIIKNNNLHSDGSEAKNLGKNEIHINCSHQLYHQHCKQLDTLASESEASSDTENQIVQLTSKLKPLIMRLSPTSLKIFSTHSPATPTTIVHQVDRVSSACEGVSSRSLDIFTHLLMDVTFFNKLSTHFSPKELSTLAQVCQKWRNILYSRDDIWCQLTLKVDFKSIRRTERLNKLMNSYETIDNRYLVYKSINERYFTSLNIEGTTDSDIIDLISNMNSQSLLRITNISLVHSCITDGGLEILLASCGQSLESFQMIGCNEISDSGLWTRLVPSLTSLTVKDCINIADDTVSAVSHMLPKLRELKLQAYHCGDSSLEYFNNSSIGDQIQSLTLDHCWEISDHGILSLAHSMSNLAVLSLTGCSQITDDAVEVITEQLRNLRSLDVSRCPRITDTALEYIAYDLSDSLIYLNLDRCPLITDVALGYASIMSTLTCLSVRWCPLISDKGLISLCSMKSLSSLALSGCQQLTETGICNLIRLATLKEVDLTNCKGATAIIVKYLEENSSHPIQVSI